jgi:hypothetical protein
MNAGLHGEFLKFRKAGGRNAARIAGSSNNSYEPVVKSRGHSAALAAVQAFRDM